MLNKAILATSRSKVATQFQKSYSPYLCVEQNVLQLAPIRSKSTKACQPLPFARMEYTPDKPWKPFSSREDEKILKLRKEGCSFRQIGAHLGRTTGSSCNRYYRLVHLPTCTGPWSKEEDSILLNAKAASQCANSKHSRSWRRALERRLGRSPGTADSRSLEIDPSLKTGPISSDEALLIQKSVLTFKDKQAPISWKEIAGNLSRNPKDIRKFWIRRCIALASGPWTRSEDQSIRDAITAARGSGERVTWAGIARQISRTGHRVRHRWNSLQNESMGMRRNKRWSQAEIKDVLHFASQFQASRRIPWEELHGMQRSVQAIREKYYGLQKAK